MTDETLTALGLVEVRLTDPPDYSPTTHECVEAPPAAVNGVWVQQWALVPRDIDLVREELHARRRARRTAAETGGFTFRGRPVDSDRDSVQRIAQAAGLAAQAMLLWGAPCAVAWTCADDSDLMLDAAGVLGLQAALSDHGAACHARSRTLKSLIDTAQTLADLSAVAAEIETGWPAVPAPNRGDIHD